MITFLIISAIDLFKNKKNHSEEWLIVGKYRRLARDLLLLTCPETISIGVTEHHDSIRTAIVMNISHISFTTLLTRIPPAKMRFGVYVEGAAYYFTAISCKDLRVIAIHDRTDRYAGHSFRYSP